MNVEPGEIGKDGFFELGSTALLVDVFDSQEEGSADSSRLIKGKYRGKSVSEVKRSGGAGREASDHGAGRFCFSSLVKVADTMSRVFCHGGIRLLQATCLLCPLWQST